MNATLEAIRDFADKAHGDQKRRYTPDRYIVHPVRVMQICEHYTSDITVLSAALLHDVLEDTEIDKEAMLRFLCTVMDEKKAGQTLQLVTELTDVYIKKAYPHWNRRKRKAMETARLEKTGAESQTIKYADILDNIRELPESDDFSIVFLKECRSLLKTLKRGDERLYQKTVAEVSDKIKALSSGQ